MKQQNNKVEQLNNEMDFQIFPEMTEEEQIQCQKEHRQKLERFYNSTKQYAIESWYHQLQQFTFKSKPFELTVIQAYVLNCVYYQEKDKLQLPQIQIAHNNLITKIDEYLKNNFPQGCFMKLSTRSPKDGGWLYKSPQIKQIHVDRLVNLLKGKITSIDNILMNKIYRYFLEESKDKIKIRSGKDFINIFAHSERIQIDINDLAYLNDKAFEKLKSGNYQLSQQKLIDVWGREWVDCSWMEQFRCFYHQYKLTAITQYDQRCYFPELLEKQNMITEKIKQFFDKIVHRLQKIGLHEGVMDLIVKLDGQDVQLIEINIFDQNSRPSLFKWKQDIHVIQNGPLQFRFHKKQIEISKYQLNKMMGMVQKGVESIVQSVMDQLGLRQQWEKYD